MILPDPGADRSLGVPVLDACNVPVGHDFSAHVLWNWCCACVGRSMADELVAWRAWATVHLPQVRDELSPLWERPPR